MITETVCAERPLIRAISDFASAPCWRTSDNTSRSLWARMPDWLDPAERRDLPEAAVDQRCLVRWVLLAALLYAYHWARSRLCAGSHSQRVAGLRGGNNRMRGANARVKVVAPTGPQRQSRAHRAAHTPLDLVMDWRAHGRIAIQRLARKMAPQVPRRPAAAPASTASSIARIPWPSARTRRRA